jgi:hypothetical protein
MAGIEVIKQVVVTLSEQELNKLIEARQVLKDIDDRLNDMNLELDSEDVVFADYDNDYPAGDKLWDIYSLLDEVICCYQA